MGPGRPPRPVPNSARPYTGPVTTTPRRLGVLGGTFDPPHVGHLLAAVNVRRALSLDEVLLVVANDPWQKSGTRRITPAEDRLAMVRAAVEGVDGVLASAIEVERGGPSYTVETVEELLAVEPGAEIFVIVGADAAGGLDTWERCKDLAALAELVVVDRLGASAPPPPDWWPATHVEIPRIELSSTDLRERVADGRPLDYLLPASVVTCIRERRLYGSALS